MLRCKFLSVIVTIAWAFAAHAQSTDFTAPARDQALLEAAIVNEAPRFVPPTGVTGITVPHHLLAPDLIARGFWAASRGDYDRIVILAPDHFDLVTQSLALLSDDVDTVFGPVKVDQRSTQALLARGDFAQVHPAPEREHGLVAVLPFLAHFFPEVPVVAVIIPMHADAATWAQTAELLLPLVGPRTLVVQSTDFAHYVSPAQAALNDQQTLAALAHGVPGVIEELRQPDHLDAIGAQSVMLQLQGDARPAILANRTSQDYEPDALLDEGITSYIVAAYHSDPAALSVLDYADQTRLFVAGDLMLGRYLRPMLAEPAAVAAMLDTAAQATGGAPILANLEGVLVQEFVANQPDAALVMQARESVPFLEDLSVVAVGLGNNHSYDLGASGLTETLRVLDQAGITALPDRQIVDLGAVRAMSVNMVPQLGRPEAVLADLELLCHRPARPPLIVLPHWGAEYTDTPGREEIAAAEFLASCGVAAVIGAHSHRASERIDLAQGQMPWIYSLGNFIFDQRADR
ncbi:MAG: AmmeMemoRadiSam system protein B, partial [Pseudomonadota bacterium]